MWHLLGSRHASRTKPHLITATFHRDSGNLSETAWMESFHGVSTFFPLWIVRTQNECTECSFTNGRHLRTTSLVATQVHTFVYYRVTKVFSLLMWLETTQTCWKRLHIWGSHKNKANLTIMENPAHCLSFNLAINVRELPDRKTHQMACDEHNLSGLNKVRKTETSIRLA